MTAPLAVIGVPSNSSGVRGGVADAPAVLRAQGLVQVLRRLVPVAVRGLGATVRAVRREGAFPVVLGGDCSILLGCLSALDHNPGPPGLLFIDSHEDAYLPHQSPTGEAGDMEVGLALGLAPAPWPDGSGPALPLVGPRDVVMLGPRDQDELEREGVASLADRVELLTPDELARDPVGAVRGALDALRHRRAGTWLHTGLGVLSTEAMPAVDYRSLARDIRDTCHGFPLGSGSSGTIPVLGSPRSAGPPGLTSAPQAFSVSTALAATRPVFSWSPRDLGLVPTCG